MKKIFLAFVLSIGLIAMVSYAEDAVTESVHSSVIAFDDLETLIRENNDTIKSNELQLITIKNPPGADDIKSSIYAGVSGLSTLNSQLKSTINAAASGDISIEPSVLLALTASQLNLQMTIDEMYGTASSLSDDGGHEGYEKQFASIDNQIVAGGESLYLAYCSMEIQRDELILNLEAINRTILELEKRLELGQVSSFDVESVKTNKLAIENGISTLNYEMESLEHQLNIMIGRRYSDDIRITPVTANVSDDIDAINLSTDFTMACENSYDLYSKENAIDAAKATLGVYGDEGSRAQRDNAILAYEGVLDNIEYSLHNLARNIDEKQRVLAVEIENLEFAHREHEIAELKYQRGMISALELTTEEDKVRAAEIAVSTATLNIKTVVNQYKWVKYGVLPT